MSRNRMNKSVKPARIKKNALYNLVIEAMQAAPYKLYNYKQLAATLGLSTMPERQLLMAVLDDLSLQEMVVEVERGKEKTKTRGGYGGGEKKRQTSGEK